MIFRRLEQFFALSILALTAACSGTSSNNQARSSNSSGGATTQAMGGSSTKAIGGTRAAGGTFSGGVTSSSAGQSGSGGTATLPQSGDLAMFLAAVDGASKPAGLAGLGTTTGAQPLGIAIDHAGRIFVAATMNAATTTSVGPISAGPFIAAFGPDPYVTGVGPIGATTGDASDHGDLPSTPFTQPDAGPPGPCPAASAQVQDGAACPVKRGCAYGNECCICIPTPCGSQPTHWYCSTLPTPDPACPTSPPADGDACSTSALHCEYCTIVGHQFATCTVAD